MELTVETTLSLSLSANFYSGGYFYSLAILFSSDSSLGSFLYHFALSITNSLAVEPVYHPIPNDLSVVWSLLFQSIIIKPRVTNPT